jgi:hypothetical protein
LAIDFNESITYFDEEHKITSHHHLHDLPDMCPVCSVAVSPTYILEYEKDMISIDLLCGCPRNECGSLFIAEYRGGGGHYALVRCYPSS